MGDKYNNLRKYGDTLERTQENWGKARKAYILGMQYYASKSTIKGHYESVPSCLVRQRNISHEYYKY